MAGQEREDQPHQTEDHTQQDRKAGLRQEQVCHHFDIRNHLAALFQGGGKRRELAIQKHQARDGFRCGCSVTHCNAEVGVFEGERIVNTVAGHCHDVPLLFERDHHVLLLLGRNATENIVGCGGLGEFGAVFRQGRGINRARRNIHAGGLRSCLHGVRVIA